MNDTKREELEKACKKIHKVRTRIVAVRMVRVLDMTVEEDASIQICCPTWVRDRLHRYDKGDPEGHDWWGVGPPRLVGKRGLTYYQQTTIRQPLPSSGTQRRLSPANQRQDNTADLEDMAQ